MLRRAAVALFLSSAVMFALEPTLAKMVLPLAGGGPSVWAACLVFFQGALLLGYVASHALVTRLGPKRQAVAVCVVLVAGLAFLPTRVSAHATGSSLAVLVALSAAAGVPFVGLSMIGPSVQRWYHEVEPTRDPYVLFAMSNAGCLVALMAYPWLEPHMGLRAITLGVTVAYVALLVAVLAAALRLRPAPERPMDDEPREPVTRVQAARWALLAFVPSAYLSAVTTHVTIEVAPIPLLWTVPLALYITTFIVAFGGSTRAAPFAARALPLCAAAVAFVLVGRLANPAWLVASLHVAAFFAAALACHAELARLRPHASQLTTFYVWIAVGGAAGSIFVALVAPLVFDQYLEYPLLLLIALTLVPTAKASNRRADAIFAVIVAAAAMGTMVLARSRTGTLALVVFPGAVLALALVGMRHPRRFALSIALVLGVAGAYADNGRTLWRERNFFGTLRVSRDATFVVLTHGTTVHGRQLVDPARRREPLSYYARSGPAQDVFALHRAGDVIIVGLGAGTLAAYARPLEPWTFIEIDPAVVEVARNPKLFTFLSDAFPRGDETVLVGDARLVLATIARPAGLLVVDAFSGDAIPTHLLTVEAGKLYAEKTDLVALHVSNRHANLTPVVARLARDLGWLAAERDDVVMTDRDAQDGKSPSKWIVMARAPEGLPEGWEVLVADGKAAWTDDATSVLPILR